ncbi:MAG: hypothetical protein KY467_09885 [Gemmatimonadetes bacterium]|nr:hypothetical protein [Gemmatimonadota bacterium]
MRDTELAGEERGGGGVRRLVVALVLVGMMGLGGELVLLEHTESVWQWVPLPVLAFGFATGVALLLRPAVATVRAFQLAMALFVVAGVLGVYLHFAGNIEFEREMDQALRGVALTWAAARGATPALAPGALAHLGLLGLACTYRHPALRREPAPRGAGGAAPIHTETR